MRKNIFNRSTLTAICLSLVMSACSDSFLDIQPQDKPGSDNFLNNLSSAQELVVASFNPWVAQTQMYGKRFATICDALTDDGGLRLNGNDLIQV